MLPISRRSKIRPPRKSLVGSTGGESGADGAAEYDKSWAILSNAITQIQNKNVSNLSYEQLYRKAYMLVLKKFGGKLYDNVTTIIRDHLLVRRNYVMSITSDVDFMKSIISEWDEHLQSMKFISDVLMYLNRIYVKEQKKLLIYDLGIQLFKDYLIKYNDNEVGNRIIEIVIEEITRNRKGEVITTKMYITKIISMLELLVEVGASDLNYGENFYQRFFEPTFLSRSETFFYSLSEEFMSFSSGSRYLYDTNQFIEDEEGRVGFYLPQSTYPKLISLMNNILIKDKIDKIVCLPLEQHGLSYWLEPVMANIFNDNSTEHHLTELRILYEFCGRIDPDYNLLKMRLKEIVSQQGLKIPDLVKGILSSSITNAGSNKKAGSNSASFATKYIESVLNYQSQMSIIIKESFRGDYAIEQCVTMAMREFINEPPNKKGSNEINSPELLSIYMDYYIKQYSKSSTSKESSHGDETENIIVQSIAFLRFIKDKDSFEAHYANHFAKRFLNSKGNLQVVNANNKLGIDLEELIISKLSEEMGTASLEKVIKMNKDIKSSNDITRDWKKFVSENKRTGHVEMDLKICNVSDWPKSMTKDYKNFSKNDENQVTFIWSRQLRQTLKEFEEFWFTGKKNDNKSLYWCPKFGSIDLRITYPSRTYEINMSTYAGIIMLLFAPQSTNPDGSMVSAFEEAKEFTYEEIKELTGIPEADLKRQLQSIAVAPRSRLLIKTPLTKDVNTNDKFRLNEKFKSPSAKVKVLTVSASSATSKLNAAEVEKAKSDHDIEFAEVQANIIEGRKIEVNAAIVRIMKSRQSINHNELIGELLKQLSNRFQPSIQLIKQRVEDLIDKEYLKRDDNNKSVYHYIA